MADLAPGQHVAGDIPLTLTLDSLAGQIARVVFRVDDQDVATLSAGPFATTLRTTAFPAGEHVVTVSVYLRAPRGGLLNVAGAPHVLLGVPLVFDQRRPTPVAITGATLEAGRPRVTWAPSRDANFYAYVVYRRPTESEAPDVWPGDEVAVLTDRTQTTFLDEALPALYGGGYHYRVAVWNRQDRAVSDPSQPVSYGTPVADLVPSTGRAAESPDGQRLYFVSGTRLVEASAATLRPVRTLELPGGTGPAPVGDVHVDPATGQVVVLARSASVWVVDPASFSVVARYGAPFGADRFVLAGGRLYVASDRLRVLDVQTGAVVGQSAPLLPGTNAVVGASPDGRSVYVINAFGSVQTTLARYDVSGAAPAAAERASLGYDEYAWDAAVGPDGRVFAFVGATLSAFDGATLQPRGARTLPDNRRATAVRARGARVYIAYEGTEPWVRYGGEIAEVDAASLGALRSWRFAVAPRGIAFAGSGALLAFSGFSTWSVPL